jgi:hypothetical protein
MSHNRRTLEDGECLVLERQLTQQNGGGVRKVAAVTPEIDAGTWLPAEHFALRGTSLWPPVHPNLPQPVRKNKTVGLVAREGADADGN